jgi:hypothetical protein
LKLTLCPSGRHAGGGNYHIWAVFSSWYEKVVLI